MCKGTNDFKCEVCYRKNATPNEFRQSYFVIVPMKDDGTCDEYWNRQKDELK
jgi:hypothetical protein